MPAQSAQDEAAEVASEVGLPPIDVAQAARALKVQIDGDYYADTISGAVVPAETSRVDVLDLAQRAADNLLDGDGGHELSV